MNGVEEIYVLSPSVVWQNSVARHRTYLPEQNWIRTGHSIEVEQNSGGRNSVSERTGFGFGYTHSTVSRQGSFQSEQLSNLEQIHRDTESALAEFDRQVKAFDDVYDNLGLVNDYCDEESTKKQGQNPADKLLSESDVSLDSSSLCLDTSSLCLDSLDMDKVRQMEVWSRSVKPTL